MSPLLISQSNRRINSRHAKGWQETGRQSYDAPGDQEDQGDRAKQQVEHGLDIADHLAQHARADQQDGTEAGVLSAHRAAVRPTCS